MPAEPWLLLGNTALTATSALLGSALTLHYTNKRSQDERCHERHLAKETERSTRIENRYKERRQAVLDFITEALMLQHNTLQHQYEDNSQRDPRGAPDGYYDGPELENYFSKLRDLYQLVALICSDDTRTAAWDAKQAAERYVWTWDNEHLTALDEALDNLRTAARVDLGIDERSQTSMASLD